jgi:hypothetical protein
MLGVKTIYRLTICIERFESGSMIVAITWFSIFKLYSTDFIIREDEFEV